MKISYNWLKKYIDVPYTEEELVDKLTLSGTEVEEAWKTNKVPDGIIVAEILERKPHPNADKLSVCRVSIGKEELQVVCGAPNCGAGLKVALVTVGTVLKDNKSGKSFKIKKSKLRGVESYGMLCSTAELGIDEDHNGIMELPKDSPIGEPISHVIESDTVYDLEITPNRPDLLSVLGIAREIRALSGKEIRYPEIKLPKIGKDKTYSRLVEIQDYDLCPKYTARIIRGVKVHESPSWLKKRLISVGLRPINNIVDITNFILLETGQPLHVFDLDELAENRIVVRRAKQNEKIVALDGNEYKLSTDNLVIADAKKPVAIAGVMGGEHSGVTEKTVDVLIESAYFNSTNVRMTSRVLNLSSDSSHRFERGVDAEMVDAASNRAAALILDLAGGDLCSELVDTKDKNYIPDPKTILCCFENIRKILGIDISNDEIVGIFSRLGFGVNNFTKGTCDVTATSFRLDVEREADLAEEVIRIYGLLKVPVIEIKALPGGSIAEDAYAEEAAARDELISLGLTECINYTLIDKKNILKDSRFKEEDLLEVINPVASDSSAMRPSLLFGVLKNLERNISHNIHDLKLFEIGTVYSSNKKLLEERQNCCILLTGRKHPERFSEEKNVEYNFYDMKGMIETWLEMRKMPKGINVPGDYMADLGQNARINSQKMDRAEYKKGYSLRKTENPVFKNTVGADFIVNDKAIVSFGEIAAIHTKGIRLKHPVYGALIELDELLKISKPVIKYRPIPQFPTTTRDVAIVVDEAFENVTAMDCIKSVKCKLLEKVEILDIYRDDSIGKNKKSIAYTLTFRNPERTLTDKEVNKAHEMIRTRLLKNLPLTLR